MSSSSILGLVNQLHSMESTFAQILMEATLKLSTLTDTNVFLLLETPEGRRYCGKRHLCDIYKTQGLCPVENDLEMELVSEATSLQVRRQQPFPSNNSFVNAQSTLGHSTHAHSHSTASHPQPLSGHHHHHQQQQQPMHNSYATGNRKRVHASSDDSLSDAASRKQMRPSFPVGPTPQNNHAVGGNSSLASTVATPMSSDASIVITSSSMATTTVPGSDPNNAGVYPSTSAEMASVSCDEDGGAGEVIFVDVKREDGDNRRCIANAVEESYLDDQTGARIERLESLHFDPSSSSTQMVTVNAGSKGDVFLDSFARKAAVDQLTLEEKLEIMKGLTPEALLKPGAVDTEEYLIFQKVCYEFCRACALECPMDEADVDAYFDANFNSFANVFPKLNTNVDVLYHMRLLTKRSYKQYLKTRGKRKNDHSKMATFLS